MSDKRYEQPKNSESEKSCGDQSSKNQPKKTKQCVVMSGAERKMEDNPDTFAQPKTKKPNLNRFESKSSRVTTDEGIKQHKKSFGEKRYKNDKDEDWKSIQKLTEQYSKPMSSWNEESVKTTGNYAVETKALAQCKMDSPAFEEECCKEYDPNNYRVPLYSWGFNPDTPDTFAQPKTKKPNLNRFESKSSRVTTDEGIKQHKKSFGEKRYKNDKDEDRKSIQKLTEQYSKPMSSWNEESVKTTGNYAVETKALAQCKMDSPAFEEECCKEYDPNNYRVALYSWGLYYIRDNHIQLHDHVDTSEYDELINMVRRFSSEENFAGLFDGTTQW